MVGTLRNSVNCLNTVGAAQDAVATVVEGRALLQVVRPIGDSDRIPAAAVSFDRVLVNGGVDHTQIVEDSAGLGAFPGTKESGHRDRRQQAR